MARHRSHSVEFKRQVAQEFLGGEWSGPLGPEMIRRRFDRRPSVLLLVLLGAAAAADDPAPMLDSAFAELVADFEDATERFMNGDPGPWRANASHRDDVTMMGAWGAPSATPIR